MPEAFRFLTAGESHGEGLTAIIDGVPAGLPLAEADLNEDLARRQRGYGRGGRMKIERDQVHISGGVRWGLTLGSPIALTIANRDWENWKATMSVGPPEPGAAAKQVTRPRPGHADLAGAMKYGHRDIRNVLERSSARETTARVAVAGVAKRLLAEFGVTILSHVTEIGGVRIAADLDVTWDELARRAEASEVRCADPAAAAAMIAAIDAAKEKGDTLGGVFEVVALGCPVGLGSYVQWDRRLDGRLAQAFCSIQAIKGCEFGLGFETARTPGAGVHAGILSEAGQGSDRSANNPGARACMRRVRGWVRLRGFSRCTARRGGRAWRRPGSRCPCWRFPTARRPRRWRSPSTAGIGCWRRAPTAPPRCWRSAAAPSATSRASWPRPICAAPTSCRCRRRCSPRSTPPAAARPPSTTRRPRTSSAPSTSRAWSSWIRRSF